MLARDIAAALPYTVTELPIEDDPDAEFERIEALLSLLRSSTARRRHTSPSASSHAALFAVHPHVLSASAPRARAAREMLGELAPVE